MVGRSVATVAELCFVAQWALLLREVSQATGSAFGLSVAPDVPLIVIAETCSWYSVLTTSNLGHVVEERSGDCARLCWSHAVPHFTALYRSMRPLLHVAAACRARLRGVYVSRRRSDVLVALDCR